MRLHIALAMSLGVGLAAAGTPEEAIRTALKLPRSIDIEKIVVSTDAASACVVTFDPASGKRIAVALKNSQGRWMLVGMPPSADSCTAQFFASRGA